MPIEGKISPKVTRARGSINSQKAKQLVLHLWMHQQSVRKKNDGSEECRRKQCYERATSKKKPGLFFTVGFFILRNECPLKNKAAALAPRFDFFFAISHRSMLACWIPLDGDFVALLSRTFIPLWKRNALWEFLFVGLAVRF